jgi:hypothetical protein
MTELLTHRQYANGEATSLEVEASGSVNIDITVYQSTDHSFAYDNSETVNITTSGSTTHPLSAFTATSDSIYWLKVSMNGGQLSSASIITDSSTLTLLGRGTELGNARDSAGLAQPEEGVQQGYAHTSLTDGLVAYYPFDSSEVTPAVDEALGNHGTINGATYTSGQIGQALNFDSSNNEHVDLGTHVQYLSNEFTVSCWFNPSAVNNGNLQSIVDLRKNNAIIIRANGDGNLYFYHSATDGTFDSVSTSISNGNWYFALMTWDGSTVRAFLDTTEVGTISNSSHGQKNNTDAGIGGQDSIAEFYNGDIDEPRIYDRALSTPEIQALYNRTKPHMISPSDTL